MARDIRDLFKQAQVIHEDMPNNHEARFLEKLETALPEAQPTSKVNWLNIAASVVVLIGLSFGAYKFITPDTVVDVADNTIPLNGGALGKVSPDLKKVEDYYLASIHLELSKMKPTAETKVVFDGCNIIFDTWNKGEVQIEAFVESDAFSKEELEHIAKD